MRICELDRRRVALWGWGREGRAAWRAVRARLPALPLTLFCTQAEVDQALATGDALLDVRGEATDAALAAFEIVIKSPGISPLHPAAVAATARGTQFIGGTSLWFAEHPDARTVCVTGTKGKSTTTALVAHLLRADGHRTALAGNIGLPLLELLDTPLAPEFWAIELSSYQTGDVASSGVRPHVAVVTNLFPEHLDWHGSEARYVQDKLALLTTARPRIAVLNAQDARLVQLALPGSAVHWFNRADGWHLRDAALYRADTRVMAIDGLPLPGAHNAQNLCAALAAIEAIGLDALALARHARSFQPLPHRLQALGTRDGLAWVDDSISTTPHATLAALDHYRDQRVALLVGGHDRGLDWTGFARQMATRAPAAIVTMAQNGPRIHAMLQPVAAAAGFALFEAPDLAAAVAAAREALAGDGVLLLSPGAPSFGAFRDYTERGNAFAALGGFDAGALDGIAGLGIA